MMVQAHDMKVQEPCTLVRDMRVRVHGMQVREPCILVHGK